MDLDGLPLIGVGVDYTQVGAIHQRRTLAFINHFVTNTVSFLNNFSRSCEMRLQKCEARIQKLEACLCILEAKLTSIPGLADLAPVENMNVESSDISLVPDSAVEEIPQVTASPSQQNESNAVSKIQIETLPGMIPAKEDPVYKRFFRMLHVGVPEPAVRLKMQAEGLDPNILSHPEQLISSQADQPVSSSIINHSSDSPSD